MSVREKVEQEVALLTEERDLPGDAQGFGYWFLERVEDYSAEDSEQIVTDGAWDGGRDAVDFDPDTQALTIWQFKWSNHSTYVETALTDIQRALPEEAENLSQASALTLKVVSKFRAEPEFVAKTKRVRQWIRTWIRNHYPHIAKENIEVELYDLQFLTQMYEELFGVEAELRFQAPPLVLGDAVLGLVDLASFKGHIDDEALYAFNIRKFLGLKKGSVNVEIKETLSTDTEREQFWMLNNGIVCLCTSKDLESGRFTNLTIVNGAQTVTTTARFLTDNPAIEDPVWSVAKIIEVESTDLERAQRLTKTSNRQTAASSRDLRSVDIVHSRMATWFRRYMELEYSYRRGIGGPRGANVLPMKDMAQAFIAFWTNEPNVSFANAGAIFSKDDYYNQVFPETEIDRLHQLAEDEIPGFLADRVVPWRILGVVRAEISNRVSSGGLDKKWRSAAFHVVWLIKHMLRELGHPVETPLTEELLPVAQATAADLLDALRDFARSQEIPRALKSNDLVIDIMTSEFFALTAADRAKRAAAQLLGIS